jgi:hypothetical protein
MYLNTFTRLMNNVSVISLGIYLVFILMMFWYTTSHSPCSFGLISRISSHPAVFFSHNKPANSAFSTINQRNEQADYLNILIIYVLFLEKITPMALLKFIPIFLALKISNLPVWPLIQLSFPYLAFPSIWPSNGVRWEAKSQFYP